MLVTQTARKTATMVPESVMPFWMGMQRLVPSVSVSQYMYEAHTYVVDAVRLQSAVLVVAQLDTDVTDAVEHAVPEYEARDVVTVAPAVVAAVSVVLAAVVVSRLLAPLVVVESVVVLEVVVESVEVVEVDVEVELVDVDVAVDVSDVVVVSRAARTVEDDLSNTLHLRKLLEAICMILFDRRGEGRRNR